MEITNIQFVRNNNSKRYIIRILHDQSVRVTIPQYGSQRKAEQFLNDNIDILKNKLIKQETIFELNQSYQSKYYQLKILPTKFSNNTDVINNNIVIRVSSDKHIRDKINQDYIKNIFEQTLRKEAQLYIPKKTMEYANQYQLKVSNIKINSAKTRWGSCSSENSLNFSLFLMQLPYELINYIILHELSHTIHKNHSKDFYNLLNKLTERQHPFLNKKLKNFYPNIKAEYFQKV